MSGFEDIEVVDLDTIDVSNLNRQFLFKARHVGQSKAKVAAEAAMAFNSSSKIVAHLGNIKAPEFGASFMQKFDIVFNALDNAGM
jgi:ubiquitin-like 1-activating enzyme E1 B